MRFMGENCIFCRIAAGEIPATVVHKSERVLAFRDVAPKAPVHVLVIPRDHHENVAALAAADPAVAAELLDVAAAVAESEGVLDSGYRLLFNSGPDAGQEVFHVHAHVLGGRPLGALVGS
jgi:histidine triad (HIT) family protein